MPVAVLHMLVAVRRLWPPSSVTADRVACMLAGYDASPQYVPEAAVTIQQPNGNIKRIAYANASCAQALTMQTTMRLAWSWRGTPSTVFLKIALVDEQ